MSKQKNATFLTEMLHFLFTNSISDIHSETLPLKKIFYQIFSRTDFLMIFITCFPSNIFWYDRTLENAAKNGKVFLFADT